MLISEYICEWNEIEMDLCHLFIIQPLVLAELKSKFKKLG